MSNFSIINNMLFLQVLFFLMLAHNLKVKTFIRSLKINNSFFNHMVKSIYDTHTEID